MDRQTSARAIKLAFAAFLFVSALLVVYSVFGRTEASNLTLSAFFYLIARACGLFGFVLLSTLIISGDVARFFDRFFGLDKIINFHRWYSLVVAVFVIFHPVFIMLSYGNFFDYIVPKTTAIPLSLGILALYAYMVVEISSRIAKRISYRIWQYLHVLTYVLFFFVLYHSLQIGSDTGKLPVQILFGLLLIGIAIGIVYRTSYKLGQRSNRFTVKEIRWETKDTFTLVLIPNRKINFTPGQFFFLRLEKPGLYARHPFSASNIPSDRNLEFTIKLKGPFTKAASQLKEGEEVKVEGPFGIFTLEKGENDIVFIAFGVGITPFMSLLSAAALAEKKRSIILLYASRSPEDIIFREKLASLKGDWLKQVVLVNTGATPENGYLPGRIDSDLIKKHVRDIANSDFYLCGSEEVKAFVKKSLSELGAKPHRIKSEEFFW